MFRRVSLVGLAVCLPILSPASSGVVLNRGDDGRLEAVFARAARGERIVLGALGGSITAGTGASPLSARWTDLVADWFVANFPAATFVRSNAGLGATGSLIGAHRIATDVAPADPDFVTVDFAVNDGDDDPNVATMDSCARQLLALPKAPAVMFVSFMTKTGRSVQDDHLVVARHYGLAHLSVKNAVWPDIAAGRRTWSSWSSDDVHPNTAGHAFTASLVTGFLSERLSEWRARGCPAPEVGTTLPTALSTTFSNGRMVAPTQLSVLENVGFVADGTVRKGWSDVMAATHPGDRLVFETASPTVTLLHWRINGAYGRARVTVDGLPLAELEGWYEETWGGYVHQTIVLADRPGRHVVALDVLPERHASSGGYRFELCKVLLSGEESTGREADTFESYSAGTDVAYVAGWTGQGQIAVETPLISEPLEYPVPEAGHERVLTSRFGVTRRFLPAAESRERICDFLLKVRLPDGPDWRDEHEDLDENRFAVAFDSDGVVCLYCANDAGRGTWLRVDETRSYADDEWVRVKCRFKKRKIDGKAMVRLSVNGKTCGSEDGSWFPLLGTDVASSPVSEVSFGGTVSVDDFVVDDRSGGFAVMLK